VDSVLGWVQANSTSVLAFAGALLGSLAGLLAATAASRRAATATLGAATRAAEAAREVAAVNRDSARELAQINRETQRAIERDRDRRAWRRHFLEPFIEHAHGRFRAWLEFSNAVKTGRPEVEIRARVARAMTDFLPPTFVWGVSVESALGKSLTEFTGADRALQDSVEHVLSAVSTNEMSSVVPLVDELTHKLSNALDELAISVEEYVYANT
jgi:hypothetical protein